MNKKDTKRWMDIYHDKWIKAHNKLIEMGVDVTKVY